LDIVRIPTSYQDAKVPLGVSLSLSLPKLAPFRRMGRIICRSEPNPVGRGASSAGVQDTRPFNSSPEDALILFNIYVHEPDSTRSFSFVVHRNALLALFQSTPIPTRVPRWRTIAAPRTTTTIKWSQWGPPITRWFNMTGIPTRWITTSHGQRYVFILPNRQIYLLDFNPYSVKRFQQQSQSTSAGLRLVQDDTFISDSYQENVMGSLPYVECLSHDKFEYDAVLMDEERIIGLEVRQFPL
jgi:hypothetical protein